MAATVIIEGANFTGKSTLIESLKDRYPVYRGLASLPERTIKTHELSDTISSDFYAADFIRQTKTSCILERSILTGHIYHNIPLQFFEEQKRLLPNLLLIVLWTPEDTLKVRMDTPEAAERMVKRNIDPEVVLEKNAMYRKIAEDEGFWMVNTADAYSGELLEKTIVKHMRSYND